MNPPYCYSELLCPKCIENACCPYSTEILNEKLKNNKIMEEKILTRDLVKIYGLYRVSTITANMLEGYTSIEESAFYDCSCLTSIELPNSITSIGYGAFAYCISLTSVTIGNSVTSIGGRAFYSCRGLISIEIPNSVTRIGGDAFAYCTGLTSITIPNSVTSIGDHAFYNCSSLRYITIGDKEYVKQDVKDGKCKAYKGFHANMTCRGGFQYREDKSYEIEDEPKLCIQGFHACLSLSDIFNYYCGKFGKNIVIHEVELEGVSNERHNDSKVVAKKITIRKRIL